MNLCVPEDLFRCPIITMAHPVFSAIIPSFRNTGRILITSSTDTTTDHNSYSFTKIFLCKFCTLTKCYTGNKICFLFSVTFISSVHCQSISGYCHIIIFSVPFLSFLLLKIKHRIVYTLCRQFQEKSYKTSDKIYTTS